MPLRTAYVRFTPELGQSICERLANGESLRTICSAPDMPDRGTVRRWLSDPANAEFREAYNAARLAWADEVFEEIATLASGARQIAEDAEARGRNAHAAVGALREEIRAKMWIAARLNPARYGDRTTVTGADGKDLIPPPSTATPDRVAKVFLALTERLPHAAAGNTTKLPTLNNRLSYEDIDDN
jgi:hypothetical protein